jgi:hypothetical protein
MRRHVLFIALAVSLASQGASRAQAPEIIYCRQASFRIPFQIEPGEQARLKEVQLYIAEEPGKGWRLYRTVGPDQRHFPFKADRDGLYSFLVRTTDVDGKSFPPAVEGAAPGLRVQVDTQLPAVTVRGLPNRGEQVGVEWEVRDANLDAPTLLLEYRGQGAGEWQLVNVEGQGIGQKYWTSNARGSIEVRLRVKDKAENQGTGYVFLNTPGQPPQSSQSAPRVDTAPRAATPHVKVINTPEIGLNYALDDVGPSGVSSVELWLTSDGRSWQRFGEDPDKQSPFVLKVNGEGTYGLTLCVKSGVGLGDKPPQPGEQPQMWIEVDLTRPVVQLLSAEAGRGGEHGHVTIAWNATDKNLIATPISLHYAEQLEGPWRPIATDLDNSGRYVWRVPQGTPFKFFVRVEALDRGGNVGRAESAKPVLVDLHQPKGRLIGAEGSGK